jgi:Lon protease-like protein
MESSPQNELALPDAMPIMALSGATHFPRSLMPLFIFEQRYREMLRQALEGNRMFGVACVIPGEDPDESDDPVYPIFTAGMIRACVTHGDGTSHLMLQGLRRVEIVGWDQVEPFRIASIIPVDDVSIDLDGEQQLAFELVALCRKIIREKGGPIEKVLEVLSDPAEIADIVGHNFVNNPERRQELLELIHVKDRLEYLIRLIKRTSEC